MFAKPVSEHCTQSIAHSSTSHPASSRQSQEGTPTARMHFFQQGIVSKHGIRKVLETTTSQSRACRLTTGTCPQVLAVCSGFDILQHACMYVAVYPRPLEHHEACASIDARTRHTLAQVPNNRVHGSHISDGQGWKVDCTCSNALHTFNGKPAARVRSTTAHAPSPPKGVQCQHLCCRPQLEQCPSKAEAPQYA